MGAAYGIKGGMNISITFLLDKMPTKIRNWLVPLIHILVIVFFVVCTIEGAKIVSAEWHQRTIALQLPRAIPFIILPTTTFVMGLLHLEQLIDHFQEKNYLSNTDIEIGES